MSEAGPAQKPERKIWKNARTAVGALAALVGVAEMTKVGTRPMDITAGYEEALRQAEEDYENTPETCGSLDSQGDGVCLTFTEFLQERNLPTRESMRALQHLIGEFKHPVHFYSGSTLLQRMFGFIGRHTEPGGTYGHWFPIEIFGHEVYLREDTTENGQRVFTLDDFNDTIAELAHAYQTERGEDPLFDVASSLHVFTPRGYTGAYDDRRTAEYKAHGPIEDVLLRRLMQIHETTRRYDAQRMFEYMGAAPVGDPTHYLTYERYETLMSRIAGDVSADQSVFDAEGILRLFETFPGFNARIEPQPDRTMRLVLIPNEQHYQSVLAFLRPYERPEETIIETAPLAEEGTPQALVETFNRYEADRQRFYSRSYNFPMMIAMATGGIEPDQQFTPELYEEIMGRLARDYSLLVNTGYFEADPTTQFLMELLQFVNEVERYDPEVDDHYGVLPPPRGAREPVVRTGEPHYLALKRIYDQIMFGEGISNEDYERRYGH